MLHQCCPCSPFKEDPDIECPCAPSSVLSLVVILRSIKGRKGRHPVTSLQFPKLLRVHFSWGVSLYRSGPCDDIVRRVKDHPCTPSSVVCLFSVFFFKVRHPVISAISHHFFIRGCLGMLSPSQRLLMIS